MAEEHAREIAEKRERQMALAAEKGEEFDEEEDGEDAMEMTDEMLDRELALTLKEFKTDEDVRIFMEKTLKEELALKDQIQS